MSYCAGCGKDGATQKAGKLRFHLLCIPREPLLHRDGCVKPMNENRIKTELRSLSALLDMINNPQPRIV